MPTSAVNEEQPQYLKVSEIAERYRVSEETIYRRCASGSIPHIRIGGDGPIRIPADGLERSLSKDPSAGVSPPFYPAAGNPASAAGPSGEVDPASAPGTEEAA